MKQIRPGVARSRRLLQMRDSNSDSTPLIFVQHCWISRLLLVRRCMKSFSAFLQRIQSRTPVDGVSKDDEWAASHAAEYQCIVRPRSAVDRHHGCWCRNSSHREVISVDHAHTRRVGHHIAIIVMVSSSSRDANSLRANQHPAPRHIYSRQARTTINDRMVFS